MDELLRAWETTFGCSTLPFGVAEVLLDDRGRPYDFAYRYINAAAASLTGHVAEDLLGEEAYALWGGDPIWLDHFYEAAYEGRASEFEAPSEMLQQFFRAEVFPVSEGLCGFTIHDVTDWILPAQRSMEKAAAGLFFYDMRYRQMLLTEQAREQSGVDSNYISLTEFVGLTFGSTLSEEVRQKMEAFLERREAFYQEGRLPNGRWLRMSLDHTDRSERFAFGFLEDFTRTKLAEERSEQYVDIIDSLGAENFALYLVDLETQELEVYRRGEDTTAEFALASAAEGDYPAAMERYIDTFVVAEDRPRVRAEIGGEALWRRLERGRRFLRGLSAAVRRRGAVRGAAHHPPSPARLEGHSCGPQRHRRDARAAAPEGGAAECARSGRACEPGEIDLPHQHVPRFPHAHEFHLGLRVYRAGSPERH